MDKMTGNGQNAWKLLNGWKQMEFAFMSDMVEYNRNWLSWLDMAGDGWKWLHWVRMADITGIG